MKRFFAALVAVLFPLVVWAAPASAGNYSNDFYLTGGCGTYLVGGVDMKVTNYDNGANQVYHFSWTRSGVAYGVTGIYIDNNYVGKATDFFASWPGHGPHALKLKANAVPYGPEQCQFVL